MQRIVTFVGGDKLASPQARHSIIQLAGDAGQRGSQDPPSAITDMAFLIIPLLARPGARETLTERVDPATRCVRRQGDLVRESNAARLYRRRFFFTGREAASQVAVPWALPVFRAVATIGLAALIHLAAGAVDLDRCGFVPVPLLTRSPSVLAVGRPRAPPPVGARAGDGVSESGWRWCCVMVFATYNDLLHLAAS